MRLYFLVSLVGETRGKFWSGVDRNSVDLKDLQLSGAVSLKISWLICTLDVYYRFAIDIIAVNLSSTFFAILVCLQQTERSNPCWTMSQMLLTVSV